MDGPERDTAFLRDLAKHEGLSPAALARKANVAVTTINRPYSGTSEHRLSQPTLDKLRNAFPDYQGWADYLAGNPQERSVTAERHLPFKQEPAEDEMVDVAEIDLRFGLGASIMDEEITEQQVELRAFPRTWLRQITTSPASQLYWAKGQGDSMEPKISEGDIILIDRSQTSASFGDLYWAISYGQTGMIKRLRPMPDGSVKILSDNQSVPPEIAYDGELNIFGRVVAVVKRI